MKKILLSGLVLALLAVAGVAFMNRTSSSKPSIVALGDSVAAGDGLKATDNPTKFDTACSRSNDAYPVILAKDNDMQFYQFACSGAKTTTGLLSPQNIGGYTIPSQIEQAKKYIPGNVVTLTVGANDVGWNNILLECAQHDCIGDQQLNTQLESSKQQLSTNLNKALSMIKSHQPKQIIITTYYQLVNNNDTCLAARGITQAKQAWFNQQYAQLNKVIVGAAETNDTSLTTINFSNHTFCDQDTWLQGIFDAAPLHPNVNGQKQISKQVSSLLKNNHI
jgi:lysophospholipase L1-like esterase